MTSLIKACEQADFPARISCVISNKAEALGLKVAQDHGIPTHIVPHTEYDTKQDFEDALLHKLQNYTIDLICLAGFMRILSNHFIENAGCDIINIHPSLLPKYKGLDTHQRALDAGDIEAGCSVHFVTEGVDEGEVIIQKSVPVLPDDTAQTLAQRVLTQEHLIYPEAIRLLAIKKA